MTTLTTPIPSSFKITNKYVWLPDIYSLPAQISYDVICGSETDEFLPCFSLTRAEWDSSECDALCWYASPHRDDFTFRTNLFRNFPTVERLSAKFRPTVGESFKVSCSITSTSATYSINGVDYAKATYKQGDVPTQGYFGFAKYNTENITVKNVSVYSELLRKNQKDLTAAEWADFISAINSLMAAPSSATTPNYEQIVNCHVEAMTTHREWGAHGGVNFLTWHRDYMWHFEQRLRSFKPNVTLPYWDWVNDRHLPPQLSVPADLIRWNVTRNSNPNFSNLGNPSELSVVLAKPDFNDFTSTIENSPYHNTLHVDVGGTMVTAASPGDPIFWLHHCFIDKIFADWQVKHPNTGHPNMSELLQPPPFLTRTNGQVWNISELGYDY